MLYVLISEGKKYRVRLFHHICFTQAFEMFWRSELEVKHWSFHHVAALDATGTIKAGYMLPLAPAIRIWFNLCHWHNLKLLSLVSLTLIKNGSKKCK